MDRLVFVFVCSVLLAVQLRSVRSTEQATSYHHPTGSHHEENATGTGNWSHKVLEGELGGEVDSLPQRAICQWATHFNFMTDRVPFLIPVTQCLSSSAMGPNGSVPCVAIYSFVQVQLTVRDLTGQRTHERHMWSRVPVGCTADLSEHDGASTRSLGEGPAGQEVIILRLGVGRRLRCTQRNLQSHRRKMDRFFSSEEIKLNK